VTPKTVREPQNCDLRHYALGSRLRLDLVCGWLVVMHTLFIQLSAVILTRPLNDRVGTGLTFFWATVLLGHQTILHNRFTVIITVLLYCHFFYITFLHL